MTCKVSCCSRKHHYMTCKKWIIRSEKDWKPNVGYMSCLAVLCHLSWVRLRLILNILLQLLEQATTKNNQKPPQTTKNHLQMITNHQQTTKNHQQTTTSNHKQPQTTNMQLQTNSKQTLTTSKQPQMTATAYQTNSCTQ